MLGNVAIMSRSVCDDVYVKAVAVDNRTWAMVVWCGAAVATLSVLYARHN